MPFRFKVTRTRTDVELRKKLCSTGSVMTAPRHRPGHCCGIPGTGLAFPARHDRSRRTARPRRRHMGHHLPAGHNEDILRISSCHCPRPRQEAWCGLSDLLIELSPARPCKGHLALIPGFTDVSVARMSIVSAQNLEPIASNVMPAGPGKLMLRDSNSKFC